MKLTRTRLLELIPGLITGAALLLPFLLSFYIPSFVLIVILLFDIYWLVQSAILVYNSTKVFLRINRAKKIDWMKKVEGIKGNSRVKWDSLIQAIILVHYNEPYDLVKRSIDSYASSTFPLKKILLILASEGRKKKDAVKIFRKLKKEYGDKFFAFVQTLHPDGLPNEIRGKSSNETWAGRWLKRYCDRNSIDYKNVILNNFDADTRVYPDYFAHLAYKYLTAEDPFSSSFQPIHIYENNIWETQAIMRVVAMSATVVYMSNTLRPFKFHNFSSRSDSFQNVVNIDFWDTDVIPEDQRQYFKMFFKYAGKNNIVRLDIPLRMDAVYAGNFKDNLRNQYNQLRRWAWGISDFPYLVKRMISDKKIFWGEKFFHLLSFLEGHIMWAIAPIYITIMGWVPILLNPGFKNTVLGGNFPFYSRYILSFALLGFIEVIIISFLFLPPRPQRHSKLKYIIFLFQWALAPFISVFITSIAAIDAQVRLMVGKRLDYQATEKKAVKN